MEQNHSSAYPHGASSGSISGYYDSVPAAIDPQLQHFGTSISKDQTDSTEEDEEEEPPKKPGKKAPRESNCYALGCDAAGLTGINARNDHVSHVLQGDTQSQDDIIDHIAEYRLCFAPRINGQTLTPCKSALKGSRWDEVRKHLRGVDGHKGKFSPTEIEGYNHVSRTLFAEARRTLNRSVQGEPRGRPEGFNPGQHVENLLLWAVDMRGNQFPGVPTMWQVESIPASMAPGATAPVATASAVPAASTMVPLTPAPLPVLAAPAPDAALPVLVAPAPNAAHTGIVAPGPPPTGLPPPVSNVFSPPALPPGPYAPVYYPGIGWSVGANPPDDETTGNEFIDPELLSYDWLPSPDNQYSDL